MDLGVGVGLGAAPSNRAARIGGLGPQCVGRGPVVRRRALWCWMLGGCVCGLLGLCVRVWVFRCVWQFADLCRLRGAWQVF